MSMRQRLQSVMSGNGEHMITHRLYVLLILLSLAFETEFVILDIA